MHVKLETTKKTLGSYSFLPHPEVLHTSRAVTRGRLARR